MNLGITFAGTGYDTRKQKIQIDPNANPKLMDMPYIANLTAFPDDGATHTETLFQIAHNKLFVPQCLVYFLVLNASPSSSVYSQIGQYAKNEFYMSGTGPFVDIIYYNVDSTYFYINHQYTDTTLVNPSLANTFTFRVKYMITNSQRKYARSGILE